MSGSEEEEFKKVMEGLLGFPLGVQILYRYLWKLDNPSGPLATWTELYAFAARQNDKLNERWIESLKNHKLVEEVPSDAKRPKAYYRKTALGRDVEAWIRKDWHILRAILNFARGRRV